MIVQHNKLLFVGVEKEADDFILNHKTLFYDINDLEDFPNHNDIYLPEGNWQILGTITESEVSFDVEPFVELVAEASTDYKLYCNHLYDGKTSHWDSVTDCKETAFRSLMQSIGAYLVNPYGEKEPTVWDYLGEITLNMRKSWTDWQRTQQTTSPKWVLLTK